MIRLLALIALCSSTLASADWMVSTFTLNGTFVDLVQLKKTPAIKVTGKAVIDLKMNAGHLLVNGKPFDCRSVGKGILVSGGPEEMICNMTPKMFMYMLNDSSIHDANFNNAMTSLVSYFRVHGGIEYTTIPIGIVGASDEQPSGYTLKYLEPVSQLTQVDFSYAASGATPF